MSHRHGPYGQNLYSTFSRIPKNYLNGAATNAWYDEIKFYNWNEPTFSPKPKISLKLFGRDLKKSDSDLLPIPKDKISLLLNMIPLETTKANMPETS
jgi:hypothetical protein